MDNRASTTERQHSYHYKIRNPAIEPLTTVPRQTSGAASAGSLDAIAASHLATTPTAPVSAAPFASHLDLLPFLFPQPSTLYQAQLVHYNKLLFSSRGGGLQTAPLPPVVSAPHVHAGHRTRSTSKVSLKDASIAKGVAAGGHGSRSQNIQDWDRSVITSRDPPSKMPARQQAVEQSGTAPKRSNAPAASAAPATLAPPGTTPASALGNGQTSSSLQPPSSNSHSHSSSQTQSSSQTHSSSVPSTPHQHARQFSFGSREPSPTTASNHSPRSAYSETNTNLPSLQPLFQRTPCKYETAQINSRRRIPYSVGTDRLEKLDLRTVKSKLSEDEERKLATDMREIYDRLLPTDAVEQNRKRLVSKLERIFNEEWPGHNIRAHLFGSSGNLLCSDDSDVDICITTPWTALEGVCMIAELLAKRGMQKVVCIAAAKVPIVKMWDPELGLACDMNVNNTLALENTRMVRIYVEADPRVRQLAMVLKHWTRRRIINDAAFGGTLSSYTWICLIIAFLQLRNPPALPALHQLPFKLPRADGTVSDFADNLKKIRPFCRQNKSSASQLLFEFFRFYAHEFDFEREVLSVRQGKLVTKADKKWTYTSNNLLCVEEPFNTSRNLGNTADEYSFRGLHLELRRAFDLVSEGKIKEACEQYVFPKEEERVFTRPPQQSRPVLLRSSSQTQSGRGGHRGGHRGGRQNGNFHGRGGINAGSNSGRRASSGVATYENNVFMAPIGMQQDLWYQNPHYQFQYAQQDLVTQMAYQENLRQLHLYAQTPAFLQHQTMGQPRMPATAPLSTQQQQQQQHSSSDRARTNSLDNMAVNTALRPDLYTLYGMSLGHAFYPHAAAAAAAVAAAGAGYAGTYPSSPVTTGGLGAQDFRRPLERSTLATDGVVSPSSSSHRSQSQPAQRSPSATNLPAAYPLGSQTPTSAGVYPPKMVNGVSMPSFIPDDADFDETPKAVAEPPEASGDGARGLGFFQAGTPSPAQPVATSSGISFGDIMSSSSSSSAASNSSPGGRRLATEQLPQTILDRRMKRASRSPSPLGHARAYSAGTSSAQVAPASFAASQPQPPSRPLVVNGSGIRVPIPQPEPPRPEPLENMDPQAAYYTESPLHINTVLPFAVDGSTIQPVVASGSGRPTPLLSANRSPVVVNGSGVSPSSPKADETSFRERIALMRSHYVDHGAQQGSPNGGGGTARLSPSARQKLAARQAQNGVIAPLDLAIGDHRFGKLSPAESTSLLSPVYETRASSPRTSRKRDGTWLPTEAKTTTVEPKSMAQDEAEPSLPSDKTGLAKQATDATQDSNKAAAALAPKANSRVNGHVRSVKSESDGGWQKAGKAKKKISTAQGTAEQPPKKETERKGG
ncbi:hypothetical protein CDD82_108 [Ophiocordyceps australis]|uniref:polynucleotide adenylyltransferase n=1 Tax=Ophiocordyceps australis TaxID=1399860 RepID=A0A2C5YN46_9HYPO|nr:hypothetical protein CDD82_108 [Ophiocordyceps australis]